MMAITIVHEARICHFPCVLCKTCFHKQYIFNSGTSFCTACRAPFPLGTRAYSLIFKKAKERLNFFRKN